MATHCAGLFPNALGACRILRRHPTSLTGGHHMRKYIAVAILAALLGTSTQLNVQAADPTSQPADPSQHAKIKFISVPDGSKGKTVSIVVQVAPNSDCTITY